jgi:hypothetical protein
LRRRCDLSDQFGGLIWSEAGERAAGEPDVVRHFNTFQLTGTDGSHTVVHATDHLSTNANGVVTVNFSNFKFSCG